MTDADRELIELAAKAAGIKLDKGTGAGQPSQNNGFDIAGNAVLDWHNGTKWNPLQSDADAFRLMVALDIDIRFYRKHVDANCDSRAGSIFKEHGKDRAAATRNAIVRAAAEIGRGMKDAN